jgi:phosphohistidine phosphatase
LGAFIEIPEAQVAPKVAPMELYLLRHGEAGKRLPSSPKDNDRALTAVGREDIQRTGESLAKDGFEFDVVATSPLRRSKESAMIVNKALHRKASVEEWPELSPEGSRAALYRRLSKLKPESSVLCVGHEPYLTTSIGEIIGGKEKRGALRIVLKKGGLVKLSVSRFTPEAVGELRWLLTPRQIRRMA